jgi:hypothetical protein
MSAYYMVSYDLSKPNRDYKKLHEFLRTFPNWAKVLESVWFVTTNLTAYQVAEKVLQHLDSDDHLVVTEIRFPAAWYNLDSDVEDWLKRSLAA